MKPIARILAEKPIIVCLCGSTRFKEAFTKAQLEETLAGKIVLTIDCNMRTDQEIFGHMTSEEFATTKRTLDHLHFRKIEISDEVLILNVDGYVGLSTCDELNYARALGKKIRWLEEAKMSEKCGHCGLYLAECGSWTIKDGVVAPGSRTPKCFETELAHLRLLISRVVPVVEAVWTYNPRYVGESCAFCGAYTMDGHVPIQHEKSCMKYQAGPLLPELREAGKEKP